MSDSEFPTELNSKEKQISKAKELATQHLGIQTKSAQLTKTQGCFGKTVKVALQTGQCVIIQFRIEQLETEPFERARALLGDKVPIFEAIEDPKLATAGVWPFYMTLIPGKPWLGNTSDIIDKVILPNLHKLQELGRDDVKDFRPFIAKLIEEAPSLKALPLFLGHLDMNEMNVLVELSPSPQPFGIACYCIQFLAGEIIDKVFRERSAFEAMDRGFWEELTENAPKEIREVLEANWEVAQTSVMIGTLFKVMSVERENVFVSKITLKALPQLMRYWIPALRGSNAAYYSNLEV
ncbi:hypothetical protein B0J14DRAFT_613695 [Halenospora varia]|nr:hypothetical protein B0J14DRAFT_613695 [Halenospora varia]